MHSIGTAIESPREPAQQTGLSSSDHAPLRAAWARDWCWSIVAALPYFSVYLAHYVGSAGRATGFVVADMAQYAALGRPAFETGPRLLYANAYDSDSAAPRIYFHWFEWLHGASVVELGLDPGLFFVIWGIVAGLVLSRVTLALTDRCLSTRRFRIPLFLITMWGGGVFVTSAVAHNLWRSYPITWETLRYDPVGGWWFFNWGRNLVFSTEATFHVFMATLWLGIMDRRWWLAAFGLTMLQTTHPYSGAQASCIVVAWVIAHRLLPRTAAIPWRAVTLSLALVALFFAYNLFYLRQFPQHRLVMENMSARWLVDMAPMIRGWLPVGLLAAARLTRDRHTLDQRTWFIVIAAATSFLLANHEWFEFLFRPIEPIHFTRGYVWLPLWLLGLPTVERLLEWTTATSDRRVACSVPLTVCGLIGVADNVGFLTQYFADRREQGVYLDTDVRQAFDYLSRHRTRGTILVTDDRISYVVRTYTFAMPFVGYPFYASDYDRNRALAARWFHFGETGPWFDSIDMVLAPAQCKSAGRLPAREWHAAVAGSKWNLFVRQRAL